MNNGRLTLFPVTEHRLFTWTKSRKARRLIAALTDERLNADLRTMAAIGLGKTGVKEAAPALCDVLASHGSVHLRRQCAAALGRIEDPAAFDALLAAAYDTEIIVRRPAISALGPLVDDSRAEILGPLLTDPERDIREAAYVAVGRSRITDKLSILIRGLADPDDNVRSIAAAQLGFLRDTRAIPALMKGVQVSGRPNHRALIALSQFTKEELGPHHETFRKLAQQEARTLRRMGY